jgi:MFS family permease
MSAQIHRTRLFTGCIVSLVATAFGFAVRAAILEDWRSEFNLSQEQIGYILGAGLFPFAISIILFSLVIDRLGNGVSMAMAFALHVSSAVITLCAPLALADPGASPEAIAAGQRNGFALLYLGTFIFALGNGTVEAVINPSPPRCIPTRRRATSTSSMPAGRAGSCSAACWPSPRAPSSRGRCPDGCGNGRWASC